MIFTLLASTFISVQVGSFTDETRAVHVVEDLRHTGYDAYFLRVPSLEGGESTYKVRVGRFPDDKAAHATATKIVAAGFPGAFSTTTDLAETQGLSADLTALITGSGKIKREKDGKRVWTYVQDYLTLYLVADPERHPGRELTDLAVWDTNTDDQSEVFVVLDDKHAYALFWEKQQSRYALAELMQGQKLSMGPAFDLAAGPEKFITVQYDQGGDLYQEKGYAIYRWSSKERTFGEVGRLPLLVVDKGEEPGQGVSRTRTEPAVEDIDSIDPDRELITTDSVQGREHVDIWDWNGKTIERVEDPKWFESVLKRNPDNVKVAEALFGAGVEKGLEGDLEGSIAIFQLIVREHSGLEEAARAKKAISDLQLRRDHAATLNQTGFDEIRSGVPELAVADLQNAALQDPGNAMALYNLAVARVALKDDLGALAALRKAIDLDAAGSDKLREKAKGDPDLAPLRDVPEFKEILR